MQPLPSPKLIIESRSANHTSLFKSKKNYSSMKHSIYSGPEQEKEPKFIAAKVLIFTKAAKKQKKTWTFVFICSKPL